MCSKNLVMFSNCDFKSLGFPSSLTSSRDSEDCGVQTTDITATETDIQTKVCHPIGIQTDDEEQCTSASYDETRLGNFLCRICPAVVKELDRVSRSNAFAKSGIAVEQDKEDVQQVLSLSLSSHKGLKVSDLSWSCTGSVLAVALSHTLHSSWCSHQGVVALYNIDSRENKSPSRKLETTACVRSISLHPYWSSIIAAGLYSGEVVVWDIARDDSDTTLTNTAQPHTAHDDSVTQVRWALSAGTSVTLVSSSLDGCLFFWKVSPKLSSYYVIEKFTCELSVGAAGVTCFAFPHHKQDTMVVAVEGGGLLHCSTTAAKPIPVPSGAGLVGVKDPVVSRFETQTATVINIEFSPHHDDVFATLATDQAIRIYSLYHESPQCVMWNGGSVAGLAWSPFQACVLACWGDSGYVTLCNSSTGKPIASLAPGDVDQNKYLSTAAYNVKSPHLFAVGGLDGNVYIWKIPVHISLNHKQ